MGLAGDDPLFDDGPTRREQIAELEQLIDYLSDHPEAHLAFLETQEAEYLEVLHSGPNAHEPEAHEEQGPPATPGFR